LSSSGKGVGGSLPVMAWVWTKAPPE
jgi:hypothetical protein